MSANKHNGTAVDDLLFIYANQTVLLAAPRLLRRFDRSHDRYYYTVEGGITEPATISFFVSTTSFVKKVLPTSPYLMEWMKKNGAESDALRNEAAHYGTLMHIALANFHEAGFDFGNVRTFIAEYCSKHGLLTNKFVGLWSEKLCKAVLSYAAFCREFKVEPVLIEGMLASDEMGIGGTLDNVCCLTLPKEGRVLAQVDFKSGGIHQSAELQLVINKMIFEENFPHLSIAKLYSWSPKDWRTDPTYTLKDQTATRFTPGVLDSFLHIYRTLYGEEVSGKSYREFSGNILPGDDPAPHYQSINLADLVLGEYNS